MDNANPKRKSIACGIPTRYQIITLCINKRYTKNPVNKKVYTIDIQNMLWIKMTERRRPTKRPKAKKIKHLIIRLEAEEKQAFKDSAKIAGAPLSVWVRERLRQAAIKELEAVGHPTSFFKNIQWGD